MQNIRVFTVYHFFWFDTRILVKLSRYTSWLFFGVWIVVVMVGRSNIGIEAMEIRMILLEDLAYYTRLHCVTVNLIFFALYFVYIASNFKELLGTRSHLVIFLYLLLMKEDKQAEKFWSIFVWDNIYTTIDTILCLVLIRWKIFQGIYINWHP